MKNKLIIALSAAMTAAAAMAATALADMSDWSEEQIMPLLQNLGIMEGDGYGNYNLDNYVSRAEMAKITVNSSKYKDETPVGLQVTPFSDVSSGSWAAPYIQTGARNGLMSGYLDGTFHPNATVTYEEAVTMVLRVLGYQDEYFGASYPYGQVNLAKNIGLLDDVGGSYGEPMKRQQIVRMIYNALDTDMNTEAGIGGRLISIFDASFTEDAVIIATPDEDNTLGTNKVNTTAGKYDMYNGFDNSSVGLRGDIVVKNGKDLLCFVPDGTLREQSYHVDGVIGSDLELNGSMIDFDENTTVYYKSNTYTYKTIISKASKGDTLKVYYDTNGAIEHCILVPAGSVDVNTNVLDRYVIYSVLDDAVICYDNGAMKEVNVKDTTTCYKDTTAYNYATVKNEMDMGDVLKVKYKSDGEIDYVIYESGNMEGPVKVTSSATINRFAVNASTQIMRDGTKVNEASIQNNDIVYYSSDLNMILAYSKKITGVYESAFPSKDMPQSVTVSGVTYPVEGVEAFNDLSSSGTLAYGDTVTLLMGRDGTKVAGVVTANAASVETMVGYVIGSGRKDFNNSDGTTYSSYYVVVVAPDGTEYTYPTTSDRSSSVNTVVNVQVRDGKATVGTVRNSSSALSGTVSRAAMKIGNRSVASNVQIIDVAKNPYSDTALYCKTYMQRMDGLELSGSQVQYYSTNANGEIDQLILQNVTGDMYAYGVAVQYDKNSNTYTIESDSNTYKIANASLTVGVPVQFTPDASGQARYGTKLLEYSGEVSELTLSTVTTGNTVRQLSDKVQIYQKQNNQYLKISINDAINDFKNYRLHCYYDKTEDKGGRVRVIVVENK